MAKRPKPIRLTRQRAEALLLAASRGLDEWEAELEHEIGTYDLEDMRAAKAKDKQSLQARDAMQIIRERYVEPHAKRDPEALW